MRRTVSVALAWRTCFFVWLSTMADTTPGLGDSGTVSSATGNPALERSSGEGSIGGNGTLSFWKIVETMTPSSVTLSADMHEASCAMEIDHPCGPSGGGRLLVVRSTSTGTSTSPGAT